MALTAAEKAEMAQLEKEVGKQASTKSGGLTAAERAEMDSLEKEVGGQNEKPWYSLSGSGLVRGAIDALPVVGAVGGGVVGTSLGPVGAVGGAGLGYAGGQELADTLRNRLLGDAPTSVKPLDQAKRVTKNVAEGAAMEMGGQALGKAISKSASYVGGKLRGAAEKTAVKATGATGLQASKFSDDAGGQLLDRKLVRFGDTPESVAQRVGGAVDDAGSSIDKSLKALDAKGVTANSDNVVATLNQKIAELKQDPSQSGLVKKLQGIVEDIKGTGKVNVPVSAAEKTKRGFRKAAGNWMDPDAGRAGKEAYLSYMDEVERAAQSGDPTLAAKFKDGKETFGLLAPIEEAATRRAHTLNQSPLGGLGDWASIGAGGAAGGPFGAAAGVIGKRMVMPRAASSGAVALDKAAGLLRSIPKFAEIEAKDPVAFKSLVGLLSEKPGLLKAAAKNPEGLLKVSGGDE